MNNGQHTKQGSFTITPGVGDTSPEFNPLPSQENLNTNSFEYQNNEHKASEMGNVALNSAESSQDTIESPIDTEQLGKIVTLPAFQRMGTVPQSEENVSSISNQENTKIDPGIIEHFRDGKVGKNDVGYIENKARTLDPVNLVEFVNKARHEILNEKQEAA